MPTQADHWVHDHVFLGAQHERNERRTWFVVGLTLVMMAGEIAAGSLFGSMALLADGWHMGTHAAALGIAGLAYLFARRHARNPSFTFGTGKFGELAAFSSAIILLIIAGVAVVLLPPGKLAAFGGSFVVDDFARFLKVLAIGGSAAAILM